jgi:hypothetical protein
MTCPHQRTCGIPGPTHNPNASRTNIMGGLVAEMHKTILPSASGRTFPPSCHPQQQTAAAPAATSDARPYLAARTPSCTIWQNANGWRQLLPSYYHGHASLSAQPAHDELCWPKLFRCWAHTNDADDAARPTADGDAYDDQQWEKDRVNFLTLSELALFSELKLNLT